MIQGIKLSDLVSRILVDAKEKKDFIVPATGISLMENGALDWRGNTMPMTPHAESQLHTYLGIPSRFVDRLHKDAPDLITYSVNRLLETKTDDTRMIRTLHGKARAFMSDQYRRLDHEDVAERVLPMVIDAGYEVRSANITESKLYIHVVSPKTEGELRVNDAVRFGWIISNSEVGQGSLNLQLFIDRLRCTNGMVLPEFSKRRAHIGGRSEAGDSYLVKASNETTKAADDALWFGVRDHIREFSTTDGIKKVMDRLKEQADAPVGGDPTAVVQALSNKFLLKEEESKSVLYSFLEEGDRTRWGLANAITQIANDHTDYDRAVELEKIGGDLLMSTGADWKNIAMAVA